MRKDLPTVTMNIKRQYFAAILAIPRRKDIEYRPMSPFWESRFGAVGEGPFELRLLNGMLPPVPEALIVVDHLERDEMEGVFRLHLGKVLSVNHWDRKQEIPVKEP